MRKRFLSLFVVMALLLSMVSMVAVSAAAADGSSAEETSPATTLTMTEGGDVETYAAYQERYAGMRAGEQTIVLDASKVTQKPAGYKEMDNYHGRAGKAFYTPEEGSVEFTFEAQEGMYNLYIEYYTEKGKNVAIERGLYINGELPFDTANDFSFNRIWRDVPVQEDEEGNVTQWFQKDIFGNEVRASQEEVFQWTSSYFYDYMGYYSTPLEFYFKDGVNTLRLEGVKEPMTIGCIKLIPQEDIISYEEYKAQHADAGTPDVEPVVVQGEHPLTKSDQTLYAYSDTSTCSTVPYEQSKMLINTIGTTRWQYPQQSITWEIEVPADGNYYIAFKTRKNTAKGMVSARRLYIDGETPFAEAAEIPFNFSNNWVQSQLEVDGEAVTYYLTKGTHQLTLETTLGELGPQLAEAEDILAELNDIYRQIIFVTGTSPDANRDYKLDEIMPEAIESMSTQADRLDAIVSWIEGYTGQKGGDLATLSTTAVQLRRLNEDPDAIAKGLSYFKSNIGSMGTWLNSARNIPLDLDYITVTPELGKLQKPNEGFFNNIKYSIVRFIDSFVINYNAVGTMTESKGDEEAVRVWINTGRDQFQTLRSLINDQFTKENGIEISLELVNMAAILPAVVAGIGPDVAISMVQGEPVNFAMRNAIADLSGMPRFDEVTERFLPQALVPYQFNGGVYALPETQQFPVLFYRTDIMQELGITKLDTWDDIISAISVLQKNNLQFGMPVSTTADPGGGVVPFYAMLKQQGGEMYRDDAMATLLDDDAGIRAFKQWTNFYINYGLDLTYDFQNRFRTGEMPLGVAMYSVYNTLAVAAPEIRGLWDFTLLPGTEQEDGTIDRSNTLVTTCCFILGNSDKKANSWEFLKWWTSAEAQSAFGSEMECILGPSARYATANLEAFEQLPWSAQNLKVLNEQLKTCYTIPEVPGSYFIQRHINNAFRKVVIQGEDAKETLLDYTYIINQEITSKRQEFGLPTLNDTEE